MINPLPIILIVNAALILLTLIILAVLVRDGARYDFNYGIDDIQTPLKRRIVTMIMLIIIIGVSAVAFNVLLPVFVK